MWESKCALEKLPENLDPGLKSVMVSLTISVSHRVMKCPHPNLGREDNQVVPRGGLALQRLWADGVLPLPEPVTLAILKPILTSSWGRITDLDILVPPAGSQGSDTV